LVTFFLVYQQFGYGFNSLFEGMIVLDSFAVYFKLLTALSTLITVFMSLPTFRQHAEYYVLLLVVTLGMFLMAEVNNLLMIILAMELVGLVSYVLAGFKKWEVKSNEASLKYVLYGAVSTGVMAFGFSYIYGMTGHTNLYAIQQALLNSNIQQLPMFVAFIMVLFGLGYKIAMVPFHFWVPDVYEGSPTPITAFFSVGPKAAGLALLIRFLITVVAHPGTAASTYVQNVPVQAPLLLAVLAVATMTLGNVSALLQTNIKRMLGYSAIAHVGYMLMALVVFNNQGIGAVMFYMVVYLFMNFGAFWIVETMTPHLQSEEISAYTGLGYRASFVAVAMGVFMFSLTGLPPLAGFIGKVYLFAAVIKQQWYLLAVIGVLNSVVSLYYYAYVVKVMFLDRGPEDAPAIKVGLYHNILIWILLIPTLVMGLYWSPVIKVTMNSIGFFFGK